MIIIIIVFTSCGCCSRRVRMLSTSDSTESWRGPCNRGDRSTWPPGCGRCTLRPRRTGPCTRSGTGSRRTSGRDGTRRRRSTRRACTGWARRPCNRAGTCTPAAPCRWRRGRAGTGRSRRTGSVRRGRPARTDGTGRTGHRSWSAGSCIWASRPAPRSWRWHRTRYRCTGSRTARLSTPDGPPGNRRATNTRPGTTCTGRQSNPAQDTHTGYSLRWEILLLLLLLINVIYWLG